MSRIRRSETPQHRSLAIATDHNPHKCIEACTRGRVEDGSFMVGCDHCDGWYHGECVGVSKDAACQLESYVCPLCREKGFGSGDGMTMMAS